MSPRLEARAVAGAGPSLACLLSLLLSGLLVAPTPSGATPPVADARLREVIYDPQAVVTVPVKRGTVTLVLLDADEAITELASGLGGDCAKPEAAWCVTAQAGGRTVFIKPRSAATAPNNLVIITTRRVHNLRLLVLADSDPRLPVYRLAVKAPTPAQPHAQDRAQALAQAWAPPGSQPQPPLDGLAKEAGRLLTQLTPLPTPEQLVSERLQAKPAISNTQYSLAEGANSQDIVPTLVFDDGRFTYLRFPGNREIPAVFQVLGDGTESLVNARIEDDLVVVDRVSRRLMLRAGTAVVGLWNEAFDIEGTPADRGTTVPGVRRLLRQGQTPTADRSLPGLPGSQSGAQSALDGGAP